MPSPALLMKAFCHIVHTTLVVFSVLIVSLLVLFVKYRIFLLTLEFVCMLTFVNRTASKKDH